MNYIKRFKQLLENDYEIYGLEKESGVLELGFEYKSSGKPIDHPCFTIGTKNNCIKDLMRILYDNRELFNEMPNFDPVIEKAFYLYEEVWSEDEYKELVRKIIDKRIEELKTYCTYCWGTGVEPNPDENDLYYAMFSISPQCPKCNGTGRR